MFKLNLLTPERKAVFDQEIIESVGNRLIEIKKDGTYLDKQISYEEYLEKFGIDEN